MLRRIIASTLLKVLCKNLYSVKSYNMEFLSLRLWENFNWGLTYFDQFMFNGEDGNLSP